MYPDRAESKVSGRLISFVKSTSSLQPVNGMLQSRIQQAQTLIGLKEGSNSTHPTMKNVKGKIILVDNEGYEKHFLEAALKNINWDIKVEYFNCVEKAITHLQENADEIFLIISDVDMPGINGIEFKKIIEQDDYLRQKAIPFIFTSNTIPREKVIEAYKYHVQGYFQKPMTPGGQAEMLETIIKYWVCCVHPNKEDLPVNPYLL
jgi:response regulator RpfG family c-di-GMP phosphodiesterase